MICIIKFLMTSNATTNTISQHVPFGTLEVYVLICCYTMLNLAKNVGLIFFTCSELYYCTVSENFYK